ncbi:class I SAM-dependent methyltransferase [Propionivibrio dicarboxylicus]|uniref:class I SAM-dependent methyltransferase n=1 Tax=Propionivibrio dicarboxylicus TaxID=83767 RepID=UPI000B8A3636|nr:class I SAM-dependent methyltransferase [Propionivibrio dicarboxylicus]
MHPSARIDNAAREPCRNRLSGCGGGHVSFRLAKLAGTVTAYDLSEDMLAVVAAEAARRGLNNIDTVRGAAEALDFAPASFDAVVSRYSAHHWQHLASGIKEARRVLKDDGIAIFIDVIAPELTLYDTWLQSVELLRDPSHVRDMTLSEWKRVIEAAGMAIEETVVGRLRLAFDPWIERLKTPLSHVVAIRSLQHGADSNVARHFDIEDDGSFTVDTALIVARPVPA